MDFLTAIFQWAKDFIEFLFIISLGVIINLVFYKIGNVIIKRSIISSLILFLTTGVMLYASLYVGAWVGMGMGVIALGMLITAIFLSVRSLIQLKKAN